MRWSLTFIPTTKEVPTDAQIVSHQLMLRAGLIRQVSAGIYSFLPLGLRSLRKVEAIVRVEMERIGCAEVQLTALQPMEWWRKTGSDESDADDLITVKDRHGRLSVLAPTHEQAIIEMMAGTISSYRQLPLAFFQIGTTFRDEYRAGSGLLRLREFAFKDAYSFHAARESLEESYQKFCNAYDRIFARCGVCYEALDTGPGQTTGLGSREFAAKSEAGDDVVFASDKGNYSAKVERCKIGLRKYDLGGPPTGDLQRVHTPGMHTIDEVAGYLKVPTSQVLKTLIYTATANAGAAYAPKWIIAVIRGDHDVNEAKLLRVAQRQFNVSAIRLRDTQELRDRFAIGFVGPDAAMREFFAALVVDPDAAQDRAWIAGANQADHHVRNFNWFRDAGDRLADPAKTAVADIRNAVDGDPSPLNDGGVLHAERAIEIGHIRKLGTRDTTALQAQFVDEKGDRADMLMGCYTIGLARLLVVAIEQSHDEHGIVWPASLSPYSVCITPVRYEGQTKTAADHLYQELCEAQIDVILDDREARPGFKFADADLIGFPIRLTVGDRGLQSGCYEMRLRRSGATELVPMAEAVRVVRETLTRL